jgi:hypothetical protein
MDRSEPAHRAFPPRVAAAAARWMGKLPLALGALLLVASACSRKEAPPPPKPRGPEASGPAKEAPVLPAARPFADKAPSAGIVRPNACGSPGLMYIFENIGSGAALFDFDRDGRLDAFINNAGTTAVEESRPKKIRLIPGPGTSLYRQLPNGKFEDVTEKAGVRFDGWGTGAAVGDVDNDGDLDLFVGAYGRSRFFLNKGDGTFADATSAARLDRPGYATSACFVDYDRDGLLDLYVVNYVVFDLDHPPNEGEPCSQHGVMISCGPTMHDPMNDVLYHNRGNGVFEDVTARAGMSHQPGAYGLGVAAGDLDRDGWPDIYVTNDTQANFLWHNKEDGTFEETGLYSGAALSESAQGQSGMGVDLGDFNGDGWLDIQVSNYSEEPSAYYENLGDGTFADKSAPSGIAMATFMQLVWGTKALDYDQDGDLDFVIVGGHVHPLAADLAPGLSFEQRILVFEGDGKGDFKEVGAAMGEPINVRRNHRGLAAGDVDGDGDLDLFVTLLDGPPLLLMNDTAKGNSIAFVLEGSRSNREGIGARVELLVGGKKQVREVTRGGSYLSSSDAPAHFGVGPAGKVDEGEIRWPSRAVTKLKDLPAGRLYLVREADGSASVVRAFGK